MRRGRGGVSCPPSASAARTTTAPALLAGPRRGPLPPTAPHLLRPFPAFRPCPVPPLRPRRLPRAAASPAAPAVRRVSLGAHGSSAAPRHHRHRGRVTSPTMAHARGTAPCRAAPIGTARPPSCAARPWSSTRYITRYITRYMYITDICVYCSAIKNPSAPLIRNTKSPPSRVPRRAGARRPASRRRGPREALGAVAPPEPPAPPRAARSTVAAASRGPPTRVNVNGPRNESIAGAPSRAPSARAQRGRRACGDSARRRRPRRAGTRPVSAAGAERVACGVLSPPPSPARAPGSLRSACLRRMKFESPGRSDSCLASSVRTQKPDTVSPAACRARCVCVRLARTTSVHAVSVYAHGRARLGVRTAPAHAMPAPAACRARRVCVSCCPAGMAPRLHRERSGLHPSVPSCPWHGATAGSLPRPISWCALCYRDPPAAPPPRRPAGPARPGLYSYRSVSRRLLRSHHHLVGPCSHHCSHHRRHR